MSIPGLGQITAPLPNAVTTRVHRLQAFSEWRFEVAFGVSISVKLLSGTAEKDGTELALQKTYRFTGIKSKILSFRGCEIEVEGTPDDEFLAEYPQPEESPMNSYLNLHFKLSAMRQVAQSQHGDGPRIMICGPPVTGKTSVVRSLASYATRMGAQPLVVNTDPKEGMLTPAGTLGASVFASIMDIEAVDGWGTTPTSGPNQVPVKLPLAFYYGRSSPDEDVPMYKEIVSRMAGSVTSRFSQDPHVKSSGMIIDTPGLHEKNKAGMEVLAHIVEELSVNIIIVLGSSRMNTELTKRYSTERTSLDETVHVILLDKSEGVVERDENFIQQICEASIKEYFFGTVARTLSPGLQQIDFDSLTIYRLGDYSMYGGSDDGIIRADPSPLMAHWTLAIVHASIKDPLETIRTANVMGFVYVADVDKDKRKMKVLAPVTGRLGDRPLLWGQWPKPHINLLG